MDWLRDVVGVRILLVDSDDAVRHAAGLVLADTGCVFACAASTAQALALLESLAFDVVISDHRPPGCDGLSLLREVRRRRPAARTVLATGIGSQGLFAQALAEGADLCVDKPLSEASLASAVTGWTLEPRDATATRRRPPAPPPAARRPRGAPKTAP